MKLPDLLQGNTDYPAGASTKDQLSGKSRSQTIFRSPNGKPECKIKKVM